MAVAKLHLPASAADAIARDAAASRMTVSPQEYG
jgi:hypothetical protein